MRGENSRPAFHGNEPMSREWHTVDHCPAMALFGRPLLKIHGARERRERDELRERDIGAFGKRDGCVEAVFRVAREPEDERAEDVETVATERPQAPGELLAGEIEPLVDVLQA